MIQRMDATLATARPGRLSAPHPVPGWWPGAAAISCRERATSDRCDHREGGRRGEYRRPAEAAQGRHVRCRATACRPIRTPCCMAAAWSGKPSLREDEGQHPAGPRALSRSADRLRRRTPTKCGLPQSADSTRCSFTGPCWRCPRRSRRCDSSQRAVLCRRRFTPWFQVLILVLAATVSLFIGRVNVSPADPRPWRADPQPEALAGLVVSELRLPRAVLAILVGGIARPGPARFSAGAVAQPAGRAWPARRHWGRGGGRGDRHLLRPRPCLSSGDAPARTGRCDRSRRADLRAGQGRQSHPDPGGRGRLGIDGVLPRLGPQLRAPSPYAAYEMNIWMLGSLSERSWDHSSWLGAVHLRRPGHPLLHGPGHCAATWPWARPRRSAWASTNEPGPSSGALVGIGLARGRGDVGGAPARSASSSTQVEPHLVRPLVGHQPSRTMAAILHPGGHPAAGRRHRHAGLIPTGAEVRLGVITGLMGTPFFFWLVLRMRRLAP